MMAAPGAVMCPLPEDEKAVVFPLVGERMLELGNKKNPAGVYKTYFESVGMDHTSIDWNGKDGALKLDLRKPISMEPFDMVTNIGTTEHVSEQRPVWCNIHNLTDLGGVICSVTPYPGTWWWHGWWYPTETFFEQFAELNGYEIQRLDTIDLSDKKTNLRARLMKVAHKPFIMPDESTLYRNQIRPR